MMYLMLTKHHCCQTHGDAHEQAVFQEVEDGDTHEQAIIQEAEAGVHPLDLNMDPWEEEDAPAPAEDTVQDEEPGMSIYNFKVEMYLKVQMNMTSSYGCASIYGRTICKIWKTAWSRFSTLK